MSVGLKWDYAWNKAEKAAQHCQAHSINERLDVPDRSLHMIMLAEASPLASRWKQPPSMLRSADFERTSLPIVDVR
jgi:hypothetical protein